MYHVPVSCIMIHVPVSCSSIKLNCIFIDNNMTLAPSPLHYLCQRTSPHLTPPLPPPYPHLTPPLPSSTYPTLPLHYPHLFTPTLSLHYPHLFTPTLPLHYPHLLTPTLPLHYPIYLPLPYSSTNLPPTPGAMYIGKLISNMRSCFLQSLQAPDVCIRIVIAMNTCIVQTNAETLGK